jgi:hypothetical protein
MENEFMRRLSLDDVLRKLHTLIDPHTKDPKLQHEFSQFEMLLVQATRPSIHVEQHIKQVAEQGQAIGVYIDSLNVGPEVVAQFNQILSQLVDLQKRRVFVSSTWEDLQAYRRTVIDFLHQSLAYEPISIEKPDSSIPHPTELSLKNIEQCDMLIGIYGERYGSISPKLQLDVGISFTELELQHARKHLKRCFCFLARLGVPDLELRPPVVPSWPNPTQWLRAPKFSEYYQRPSKLRWLSESLKSWFTDKPSPRLLMERARHGYEHTLERIKAFNERTTTEHLATVKEISRDYDAAYTQYEYQLWGQTALRRTVREAFLCYEFGSLRELVAQVDMAFGQFQRLKMAGLAPSDIICRWNEWLHLEQETLTGTQLYWRPLLPSALEKTGIPLEEASQVDNLWWAFIKGEWHERVRNLAEHVHRSALNSRNDPYIKGLIGPLGSLPGEVFSQNYENIIRELRRWCEQHKTEQGKARGQLEEILEQVQAAFDQWCTATQKLSKVITESWFARGDKWHERVKELTEDVHQLALGLLNDPHIAEVIEPPDVLPDELFSQNYASIIRELRQWCEQQKTEQDKAKERLEEALNQSWKVFNQWHIAAEGLWNAVTEPRFGRCLLVVGRSGSGKTHLIARLLGYRVEDGICALHLQTPQAVEDWESLILKTAQLKRKGTDSGPQWRSLEELDRYLSGKTVEQFPSARLVILIDKIEDWIRQDHAFLSKLQMFISKHTQLHTLYWVITLSEFAYDSIVNYEDFSAQYGFQPARWHATLPGWLSLDGLNEEVDIWEVIFHYQLHRDDVVQGIRQELAPASLQLLSNPFIAWIIAELLQKGVILDELLNLNFIDFVEELWDLRLDELAKKLQEEGRGELRVELERAVKFIAGRFAEKGEEQFLEEQLPDYLVTCDGRETRIHRPGVAKALVDALIEKHFLAKLQDLRQAVEEGRTVHLGILPFWQYWGGRSLVDCLSQQTYDPNFARQIFEARFSPAASQSTDDSIAGLLEFTILRLDQVAVSGKSGEPNRAAATCVQQMTQFVVTKLDMIRPNIWLAAAKASPTYQQELSQWLESQASLTFGQREELHRYMYFLKNARLPGPRPGIPPHLRLKLLRPYYSKIGEMRLDKYFASLVEHILVGWVGGQEVARAIAYLYGTECFWDAERWGGWAFGRLHSWASDGGDVDWDTLVSLMLVMLAEVSQVLRESRMLPTKTNQTGEQMRERDRLWAWVIANFCESIVTNKVLRSFHWLAEHRWFRWPDRHVEMHPEVTTVMEEQLTTELGRWYRKANQEGKNDYITMIEILVGLGSGLERATAVFLIYHTIPNNRPNLRLDDRLWDLLDALRRDDAPEVEGVWRIKTLADFYERQKALASE